MVRRAKTTVTSSSIVTLRRSARIAERDAKEERKRIAAAEANAPGTSKRRAPIPATTPPAKRQKSTAAGLITPVFHYFMDSSDSELLDDERKILLSSPTGSPHATSNHKSNCSGSSEYSDSSGLSQFFGEEWSDDSSELSDVPNDLVSPPSGTSNSFDEEGYIGGDEDDNPSVGSHKTLRAIYQQYRSPETEDESRGFGLYRRIPESESNPSGDKKQVVVYFRGDDFEDIGSDDLPTKMMLEEGARSSRQ
ncbi:hypothetical protein RUND412_007619 [Rhizina undulata]